jgi:hypothetical protein
MAVHFDLAQMQRANRTDLDRLEGRIWCHPAIRSNRICCEARDL